MGRFVLRPLKLSNSMTTPAGTLVAIPASAAHRDEIYHPNPEEFDGFRFAMLCEEEGDPMTNRRYQAVSVSNEHLPLDWADTLSARACTPNGEYQT
jgi:cytochrome P450